MATRGTAYLLLKDDCVYSTEFNGDMYPDGHGDHFFKGVSNVGSEMEFIDFIVKFNNETFRYDDDLIYSDENPYFYDDIFQEYMLIDFRNNYFERFFSDWIFFKNLSGLPIKFIDYDGKNVTLLNEEEMRFNFGSIYVEEEEA